MKTVYAKTIGSTGLATLTTDGLKEGIYRNGDLIIYAIHNVPEDVPESKAVQLINQTIFSRTFSADYTECGPGKIVKGSGEREEHYLKSMGLI